MDFSFAKDQDMIRKSAREFLEKECSKDKVRELKTDEKGYDPQTWKKMIDLGWMGLIIPEAYGGSEGEFIDVMILMEEMGRNILPGPFFSTVALCSLPILAFGSEQQKKAILPRIADGEIWSLALLEKSGEYEASDMVLEAVESGGGYDLSGSKLFVPYANVADQMLVVARTGKGERPEAGLTVLIVENTKASNEARTEITKESEFGLDAGPGFGA